MDVERTPPVRRPLRREARLLDCMVAIVEKMGRLRRERELDNGLYTKTTLKELLNKTDRLCC